MRAMRAHSLYLIISICCCHVLHVSLSTFRIIVYPIKLLLAVKRERWGRSFAFQSSWVLPAAIEHSLSDGGAVSICIAASREAAIGVIYCVIISI